MVEHCTAMAVPERHPYGGALVYTAFSGSHQDAIKKGFDELHHRAAQEGSDERDLPWDMPYLPLDPRDVGRDFTAVVRITSQSGKGGVGYVLDTAHGLNPPRELRIEFAAAVQALADEHGGELSPARIFELFAGRYLEPGRSPAPWPPADARPAPVSLYLEGIEPCDGWPAELGARLAELGYELCERHLITAPRPPGAQPAAYAAVALPSGLFWGAGTGADPFQAAEAAVRSATARGAQCATERGHR